MKKSIYFAVIFFVAIFWVSSVFAANWYVDNAKASGSNNGTSWTNAWRSFADINWGSINPGDTIYISGGATSKTYNETLTIGASGSNGSPITIAVGTGAGHNGTIILDEQNTREDCINIGTYNWITIDGEVSGQRHIECKDSTRYGVRSLDNQGITLRYLYVHDTGNSSDDHGVLLSGTNCLIEYCIIENSYQDGLRLTGLTGATGYAQAATARYNIIRGMGDDGVVMDDGVDFYGNTIGPWGVTGAAGHPDGIQMYGGWNRIYNNTFYDDGNHDNGSNALLFVDLFTNHSYNHHRIYNNVFYVAGGRYSTDCYFAIMIKYENLTSLDDVLIADNTFVDIPWSAIWLSTMGANHAATNFKITNNIIYNASKRNGTGNVIALDAGNYTTSDVIVENNAIYEGPKGSQGISFDGTDYGTVAKFDAALGFNNKHCNVAFTNYIEGNGTGSNYHLTSSDTCAKDAGSNLSAIFTFDKDNNMRLDAKWDIGAYEFIGIVNDKSRPDFPKNLTIF
jgi:hypothetical protein